MGRVARFGVLFVVSILFLGCVEEDDGATSVRFSALFANLESVAIYNEDVELVEILNDNFETQLMPGFYYLDIRDDYDNTPYDENGRLFFQPVAMGAELSESPIFIEIDGNEISVIGLTVYENGGVLRQALYDGAPTGDRGRLLWEATRAMRPYEPTNLVDSETWYPAGTMYATASYVSTDEGAWNAMLNAYGDYACCVDGELSPCYLSEACSDVSTYECQDTSCTNNYHGGQCKAFQNLICYRSGIFHGENWAWRSLPVDSWISSNCDNITSGSIQAGDVLRYPYYHSIIVARVFSSTSVMVIDSNWVGGNGYELIGAHEMSFSGSGVSDLDNYRVLDCVYNNDCSSNCN